MGLAFRGAAKTAAKVRRTSAIPLLARTGRLRLVVVVVSLCFCGVAVQLWRLHIALAPKLRAEAEAARRSFRMQKADRGHITDVKGALLATSREVWDVGVDPNEFTAEQERRLDEIAASLSRIIGVPRLALLETFTKKVRDEPHDGAVASDAASDELPGEGDALAPRKIRWVKLAEGLDKSKRDAIDALKVKCIYCTRRFVREYPRGRLAAHIIGYVNKEGQPAMGIEKVMDFYLKGEDGWIDSRHDAKKREMADKRLREVPPTDGQTVELTIDGVVQGFAEDELVRIASEMTPLAASIIVSEAKSGRILALANYPDFDLNEYNDKVKAPLEAQKNRAVTDVYEPGSVFKIVSVSAGLQEGLYTPESMIDCGLSAVPYKGKVLGLPADSHHMGAVNLRHVVWQSSNRGTVQVGMRVAEQRGEERLWKYMADFGFGSECGLVTGTESKGILHKPKNWDGQTITRLPMGHAVSVTALQMHFGMSVIAAKGDLYAPMLINRVLSSSGEVVREFEPVMRRRQIISRKTAETVADMLRGVCSKEGTADKAAIPGYEVAGKTGTTQKIINGHYSSSHHVASFSGFFPAADPRLVITVIVDEPHVPGTAYGGRIAAPAFKNVAEKTIKWLDIRPVNQAEFAAAQEKERRKSGVRPAPSAPPAALNLDLFSH